MIDDGVAPSEHMHLVTPDTRIAPNILCVLFVEGTHMQASRRLLNFGESFLELSQRRSSFLSYSLKHAALPCHERVSAGTKKAYRDLVGISTAMHHSLHVVSRHPECAFQDECKVESIARQEIGCHLDHDRFTDSHNRVAGIMTIYNQVQAFLYGGGSPNPTLSPSSIITRCIPRDPPADRAEVQHRIAKSPNSIPILRVLTLAYAHAALARASRPGEKTTSILLRARSHSVRRTHRGAQPDHTVTAVPGSCKPSARPWPGSIGQAQGRHLVLLTRRSRCWQARMANGTGRATRHS